MSDVLPGLSQAITSSPILSHLLTVGGQSLFLLAAFLGADVLSRKYWPHVHKATSHTLWQFAFLMLALMPVLPFLSAGLQRALPESRLVSPVFEVLVQSTEAAARSNGPGLAEVVVTLYVMVALALLLRLGLACIRLRRMRRTTTPDIPAQPMFERKTLKTRLSHVLEETTMKNRNIARQMRTGMAGMVAFTLLVMTALVFNPILLAQDSQNQPDPDDRQVDQELMPLHTEEPVYPEEASANDVGGWVQVRFTISDEGTVVADSVSVVDAEPAGVFEESAMAATKQFRFRPRIVDGVAQTIPGVQYVFRFDPDE